MAIQVSGGCRCLHSYRNNTQRLVNFGACVGSLLSVTSRAKVWGVHLMAGRLLASSLEQIDSGINVLVVIKLR